MFLRFTKGRYDQNKTIKYMKCVFLGGSLVMEYDEKIVGIARLHEETDKYFDYDVIVSKDCEIGAEKIARYIKDMIGKSNKFLKAPSNKRRKYFVQVVEGDVLPIEVEIKFTRI